MILLEAMSLRYPRRLISAGITALAGAQILFEILCLSAEAFTLREEGA